MCGFHTNALGWDVALSNYLFNSLCTITANFSLWRGFPSPCKIPQPLPFPILLSLLRYTLITRLSSLLIPLIIPSTRIWPEGYIQKVRRDVNNIHEVSHPSLFTVLVYLCLAFTICISYCFGRVLLHFVQKALGFCPAKFPCSPCGSHSPNLSVDLNLLSP